MKFTDLELPGIFTIEPKVFGDARGYFSETFRLDLLEQKLGHSISFVQDNESFSQRGVLRGLHYQAPPFAQTKLVRVLQGRVLDVAVDLRQNSPTFGQSVGVELSGENKKQLFIPQGFAHGFVVLSQQARFSYKVDNYYAPNHDKGLAWDDPDLCIDWQLPVDDIQLSQKDTQHPRLRDIQTEFDQNWPVL
ncbi:dTDP-4-dehydrorhamnose 3,5-epimerase [Thiomicrospira sp. WB1]|uniref:dTDP-4-dehydrorhamnose 3,5-epimerase n=1 Tax=Thiomicrospira sp. WB1 TaxID=1685380 RepID=UPI000746A9F5|nr:dTDP-4-dehydrorhamnose 3,5-epimerase [Thiomicrospira sp. WB1]KUJ72474.1 dTDP-4-dehydrorhamnose 3,5-epimerase [Thiomicrospira sp. WB1]